MDEKTKSDVINDAINNDEFVTLDDGFKYYWPSKKRSGAYASYHLRILADELDRLNKEWSDKIDADFEVRKASEQDEPKCSKCGGIGCESCCHLSELFG